MLTVDHRPSLIAREDRVLSQQLLDELREFDTPTICNALETLEPSLRSTGFTRRPLISPSSPAAIAVGYARTATICSRESPRGDVIARRLDYYAYVEAGTVPSIVVMQDVDGVDHGLGAFWGEVQTNVHSALGCVGLITDGAIRDLAQIPKSFFVLAGSVAPSHVFADILAFDVPTVVAGMSVMPNDLIHADRHGAVVIPEGLAKDIPDAARLIARRERVILEACGRPDFSVARLREAFKAIADIH
jgi:regulator of RNase E activity RraA